jgi:large subunit ribosomal protein L9
MQVILLEKVGKWGNIGSVVTVKDGFARNYLFPRNKAIRATKNNLVKIEARRAELEQENQARKAAAEKSSEAISGMNIVIIRQAGEDGRLYGSITARDVARALSDKAKQEIDSEAVSIPVKIKEIGIYNLEIALHPDVKVFISLNVARSDDEAKAAIKKASTKPELEGEAKEKPAKKASLKVVSEEEASEKPAKAPKKASAKKAAAK